MDKKDFPCLRGECPLAGPVQQPDPQLLLQGRDMLADRRLCYEGNFRPPGKTAAFRNCQKDFESFEIHGAPIAFFNTFDLIYRKYQFDLKLSNVLLKKNNINGNEKED
jgi:hypothetical protein